MGFSGEDFPNSCQGSPVWTLAFLGTRSPVRGHVMCMWPLNRLSGAHVLKGAFDWLGVPSPEALSKDTWKSHFSKILHLNIWAGGVKQLGFQFFSPLARYLAFLCQLSQLLPIFLYSKILSCLLSYFLWDYVCGFFLNPFSVVFVGFGKGTRLDMGSLCHFNPNPQEAF